MIEKIKEKMHIIVMTIIIIYLIALGIKTGHLVYTEIYMSKDHSTLTKSVTSPHDEKNDLK